MKGDIRHMKGDSRQATLYYKYKKDLAVLFFGDQYSLVKSQHVVGKSVIDFGTIPRYAFYEELHDCIKQCHIDQEGHSGIRKTENAVRKCFVNISREMCVKFINACQCQLDHKHPAKADDVKPISSTFNNRGQVDLINMTAYKDGEYEWILHYQDHHDKIEFLMCNGK